LALAAKKCRPIGNYFVRKISTTSVKDPPEVFVDDDDRKPPPERHTDLFPTQSEDDGDKACKVMMVAMANTAMNNTTGGDVASSPLSLFSLHAAITEAKGEAGSATHCHAGIVALDVPAANSSSSSVAMTINDENAPPNEKRAMDDLRDGFLPLGKPRSSFGGTKTTRILATVPTETTDLHGVPSIDYAVSDGNNLLESLMATRSVSTASTTFFTANATTTRSMLKDRTKVFVAVLNEDDKKPPLPLEWTRIGKSLTDSFDVVEIEEVKWGMRICNCGCQEIADPTTSVLFHDEHGDNQAWLSEEFNTRTDYSIKLVPIRIPSNLKHVEMYREAAREMWSLPEYRNDYVFVEYLIHLMIQEVNCDNMLQSIVIQVTLCSTARLGASMSEYGWTNKGNSEKSP
jgi:hypothetical protein